MKVLIFLGNDAGNQSIEPIVRGLRCRHHVKIVAQSNRDQQLQSFQDISNEIIPAEKYTKELVDWADCIFCTVLSATALRDYQKYIFCFCHMNACFDEPRGYDFVFTLGDADGWDVPKYFASMPVGLAKNDIPVTATPKKQILYIDAGHFPFGKTGQRQIAEMLLRICEAYQDYNICVKPRWFPGATDLDMSNPNFGHIYNELNELSPNGLPSNLELLYEYRSLQELIDESSCVISSCTSAYLDAAMRGKPLLIIKGIENEDMYHLRSAYFENLYQFMEGSGCVVDYSDILSCLPEGKMCNPRHLEQSFAYPNGAAKRVIEVMEYIYEHYIVNDIFPDIKQYHYETYQNELSFDNHLAMKDLLANRRFCATETCVVLTYKISQKIDWRPYYKEQMELCRYSVSGDPALRSYSRLKSKIIQVKCRHLLRHPEFIKNDVDESYYYYAVNEAGSKVELLNLYEKSTEPHSSLHYYVGMLYESIGQSALALHCLQKYLLESIPRNYPKYITDEYGSRIKAFRIVFSRLIELKAYEELAQYAKLFLFFAQRHPRENYFPRSPILSRVRNALRSNGFAAEAVELSRLVPNMIKRIKLLVRLMQKVKSRLRKKISKFKGQLYKLFYQVYQRWGRGPWFAPLRFLLLCWYRLKSLIGIYNTDEQEVLKFQARYSGEACFVVGNGPSLTAKDLEQIKAVGYPTFASNKIYKMFPQTNWRPDYYACFDTDVFQQNLHEILSQMKGTKFVNKRFKKMVQTYQKTMNASVTGIYYSCYYGWYRIRFQPQAANITSGGSVTFALIELAWMMGFRKIYLIGCDHNYDSFQGQAAITKIRADEQTNKDYFAKDYVRPGEIINVGDLQKSTKGYKIARKYIERHGGHLYNATRGGKLEVLERVDLDQILAEDGAGG